MHDFLTKHIEDDMNRTDARVTVALLLVVITMAVVPIIVGALFKNLRNAFI